MDIRHFVILECRHLANGCVLKCGCIGLMLFRNLSCLGTIICYINTIGIVPAYACAFVMLWLQVVQPLANVHETKWTPHVKRESDVAQSYNSSDMNRQCRNCRYHFYRVLRLIYIYPLDICRLLYPGGHRTESCIVFNSSRFTSKSPTNALSGACHDIFFVMSACLCILHCTQKKL